MESIKDFQYYIEHASMLIENKYNVGTTDVVDLANKIKETEEMNNRKEQNELRGKSCL